MLKIPSDRIMQIYFLLFSLKLHYLISLVSAHIASCFREKNCKSRGECAEWWGPWVPRGDMAASSPMGSSP